MSKRKKQKQYRLSDLVAIAEQLGGRIKFDLIPIEMIRPQMLDKGSPEIAVEVGKKPRRGSSRRSN